jgi:predicted nucleic acid-binding protein
VADALIDSDVLIDVLKGRQSAAAWIAEYSRDNLLITSSVNVFELARGWDSDRATEAGMALLREFIILPLDTRAALEAAVIDTELRQRGTPLDAGDLLIAGIARASNLGIITRNVRHFSRIPRLEVVVPSG